MFLLDPLLIKWLIDCVLPQRNFRLLLLAAAAFFGIYICRLGLSALAGLVSFRTMQDLVFRIRLNLLEKMNQLSPAYHEGIPIGEKLYRMEQDVDQVAEVGSNLVPYVLQTGFNSAFVIVAMCLLNFRLACVVLPLLPVFLVFRRHFDARLRRASDSAQQQSSRESSFLQEHLSSIVQVQLLRQEQSQIQAFLYRAMARVKALNDRALTEILFTTCYMAIIAVGAIMILGYGGYQVFVGTLSIGGLVAFYSYMARLFDPLYATVEIYSRLNRLRTSVGRILEVFATSPSVLEYPNPVHLPSPVRGCLELGRVSFSYGNGPLVVEDLNLKIEAGEKIALVGASGSGKSTIAKLIARLYDVNQGTVRFDGIDIRSVRLESHRARVCYLMQDAVLFDRTLKENLLLGKPSATPDELVRAIALADLEELLRHLPSGWDTSLGPGGHALSGGERQRLALARAVLREPNVFLLDESTSALDAPSEQRIFANLRGKFRNETFVLISHRISALQWADRIVVLDRGRIREQGTHNQLFREGATYSRLCGRASSSSSIQSLLKAPREVVSSLTSLLKSTDRTVRQNEKDAL